MPQPSRPPRPKPALRTELLFNLAFLASAALLLGVGTTLVAGVLAPGLTPNQLLGLVMLIVALDVSIFIVFGGYLVRRHVLRPVERLMAVADALAAGDLQARAPDAETRDFTVLGERLNRMTDHLLDAQGHLVRVEKLAGVGRVAAGIAHEVGNPLGAIGTYVEVLRRRGSDPEVAAGIAVEIDRIDRIVRSLLDYARPRDEAPQPIDIAPVVRGAFELLQSQGALRTVRATLEIGSDVPLVLGRAHALEQAIVNLVLNAVDALEGAVKGEGGGQGAVVAVGARRWAYEPGHTPVPRRAGDPLWSVFPRAPERRPAHPDIALGAPGALVFVADSGSGVSPEDRPKVFEPFFTTKEPGRGTGLGLAIVARAIYDMGGLVWVDTAREGGAVFKIFLPEIAQ